MPHVDAQIRSAIDSFVADLSVLVRDAALDSVSVALGGSRSRSGGRGVAAVGRSRRSKGQKRNAAELEKLQDELLAAVKAKPGSRMEHLSKVVGASTRELMLVTKKLLASKAIRKRGWKRATTYFPAGRQA